MLRPSGVDQLHSKGHCWLEIKSEVIELRDKIAISFARRSSRPVSLRARPKKSVADARGASGLHCGEAALRL
jgi:hypothetical protein